MASFRTRKGLQLSLKILCMISGVLLSQGWAANKAYYDKEIILYKAFTLFDQHVQHINSIIEKSYSDFGPPHAYITGEEVSGVLALGVRYGAGTLNIKNCDIEEIKWFRPSLGLDTNLEAEKVLILIYNLQSIKDLLQRFSIIKKSLHSSDGLSIIYYQAGNIILAAIRQRKGMYPGADQNFLYFRQ